METKISYASRLVQGFADGDLEEGFKKPKGRNKPLNYGHPNEDIDGDVQEQKYFALDKKGGKWKKRTIRG